MSEEKSCSRCIHKKMCIARSSYDAIIETWNEQYPFVKMPSSGDALATHCTEYKTLSDIHLIGKPNGGKKEKVFPK